MTEDVASSLRGRKVLITGGLGFIGSNLAKACVMAGAQVTVYDNLDSRSGGNLYNVVGVRDKIRVIMDDIRNIEPLSAAVAGQDIIFHCAAHTSHSNSMMDPLIDVDVNCRGVISVLEAARRAPSKIKVVYVGTSTQIGVMHGSSIDEKHSEFPLDIYSANKSVGEKYSLIYHNAHGLQTTVVRLVNVFGPRAHIATTNTCFINYFIGLALQKKSLSVFGDGRQLRSVCYVDDAVNALIMASVSEKTNGEVYFASDDRQYSIAEIAHLIAEVGGVSVKTVDWPQDRRAIEPGDAVISHAKLSHQLGWEPQVHFAAGLRASFDYYHDCFKEYISAEPEAQKQKFF